MENQKKVKYPLRVGKKKKLALLDDDGIQIGMFLVGHESLAQQVCDLLNQKKIQNRSWDNYMNSIF